MQFHQVQYDTCTCNQLQAQLLALRSKFPKFRRMGMGAWETRTPINMVRLNARLFFIHVFSRNRTKNLGWLTIECTQHGFAC